MKRYVSDESCYESDAENGVHTLHYNYTNDKEELVCGVRKWLHNTNEEAYLDYNDKTGDLLKKIKNSEIKEWTTRDGLKHFTHKDIRWDNGVKYRHEYQSNIKELYLILDAIIGHLYHEPSHDRLMDLDYYFYNGDTTWFNLRYPPYADKSILLNNLFNKDEL